MKTNFKKLFVSILTCISVVPSINFKVGARGAFLINSAADWINVREHIRLDEHYTERKHFVLNNDIVLSDEQHICWNVFNGTLDGNGHKIIINDDIDECLIDWINPMGSIRNVKFAANNTCVIAHNSGRIEQCTSSSPFLVFVNFRSIRNCKVKGHNIVVDNRAGSEIVDCSLFVNEARIVELKPGAPNEHNHGPFDEWNYTGDFDLWNSTNAQHFVISYGNSDNISNCELIRLYEDE